KPGPLLTPVTRAVWPRRLNRAPGAGCGVRLGIEEGRFGFTDRLSRSVLPSLLGRQFSHGGEGEIQFRLETFERQGEIEGAALAGRCLGPDAAAVALDDALGKCQARTGTFEIHGVVLALEHHEQVVRLLQIEAGTVVLDV